MGKRQRGVRQLIRCFTSVSSKAPLYAAHSRRCLGLFTSSKCETSGVLINVKVTSCYLERQLSCRLCPEVFHLLCLLTQGE